MEFFSSKSIFFEIVHENSQKNRLSERIFISRGPIVANRSALHSPEHGGHLRNRRRHPISCRKVSKAILNRLLDFQNTDFFTKGLTQGAFEQSFYGKSKKVTPSGVFSFLEVRLSRFEVRCIPRCLGDI